MIRRNGAGDLQLGEKYVLHILLVFPYETNVFLGIAILTTYFRHPHRHYPPANHYHIRHHMPVVETLPETHDRLPRSDANPRFNSGQCGYSRMAYQWPWHEVPQQLQLELHGRGWKDDG